MPRTATAPAKEPEAGQNVQAASETPAQVPLAPALVSGFDVAVHREEIAQVAYRNWLERADGPGSPEQDWLMAVSEIRAKYTA